MLSGILETIRCKLMAFDGSKFMHFAGKLWAETGN
jgi:hypothetical protein